MKDSLVEKLMKISPDILNYLDSLDLDNLKIATFSIIFLAESLGRTQYNTANLGSNTINNKGKLKPLLIINITLLLLAIYLYIKAILLVI